jgi:PIN domain nuclease of toxin-antitoxin system
VNLLLDSHTFLWFIWDDPNLSPTAKSLIEDPANRKLVSVATSWEIAIEFGLKRLDLREPASRFLRRESGTNGFGLMHIEPADATFVETVSSLHGEGDCREISEADDDELQRGFV